MPSRRPPPIGLPDDRGRRERAGPVPGPREPMTRPSRSALIVSDSAPLRRYINASLAETRFNCIEASSGFQATDLISSRRFDLYVIDLDMPLSDGLAIFAITLTGGDRGSSPPIIGYSREPTTALDRAPWAGARFAAVLQKPFQPDEIIAAAKATLETRSI